MYQPLLPRQFSAAQKQKRADRKRKHDSDDAGSSAESDEVGKEPYVCKKNSNESLVDAATQGQANGSLTSKPNPAALALSRLDQDPKQTAIDDLVSVESTFAQKASSKARHLNNLTAVLHRCILEGDWERAHGIWTVLVRIEIYGSGLDLRRNGLWVIGAEVLMRKVFSVDANLSAGSLHPLDHGRTMLTSAISDLGLKLAREYYERLVLQYPYTQRAQHALLNSKVIYPALFNVWVFEVQQRFAQERGRLQPSEADRTTTAAMKQKSDDSDSVDRCIDFSGVIGEEIVQVKRILYRLDELLSNPPYDTCSHLLKLRESIRVWIRDLQADLHAPKDQRDGAQDRA